MLSDAVAGIRRFHTRRPNLPQNPQPVPSAVSASVASADPRVARNYIPALDGWRALAILMVLFAHGSKFSNSLPVDLGSSGVTFFLILSGYLITTRLLTSYSDGGNIAFQRFYIQRAFRILPPIIAYHAVLLLLTGLSPEFRTSRSEIVASLFFWRNYLFVPDTHALSGWFTGHFWSLSVEEHFYVIWPILIHFAGRKRGLYIALLGAAGCSLWRWVGWHYKPHLNYTLDHVPYFFRTDIRLDAMLLGGAVAIISAHADWEEIIRRYLSVRETIVCVFLLGIIWLSASHWFTGLKEELAVTALLTITILYPTEGLARALACRPMRAVGKLSYSLYIWQQLFLVPETVGWWNRFPTCLLLVFAASLLSYFFIERPMRQLGALAAAGASRMKLRSQRASDRWLRCRPLSSARCSGSGF